MKKKNEKKEQVNSVWCPNCGIPRNSRVPLKLYFKKTGKVKFNCTVCGFVANFVKIGKKEKKEKKEETITKKDISGLTKAASLMEKFL